MSAERMNQFYSKKNYLKFCLLILGVFLMMSCSQQLRQKAETTKNTVFFNSFESTQDTLRWYWTESPSFSADTPPGGGTRSLKVEGGMMLPSGTFVSQPLRNGGYFTVQCWGKSLDFGGYIELSTVADHDISEAIQAHIVEPEWQPVAADGILYCPPNKSLMLTLHAGMLVEGGILVDMLEVKKVGRANPNAAQDNTSITMRR